MKLTPTTRFWLLIDRTPGLIISDPAWKSVMGPYPTQEEAVMMAERAAHTGRIYRIATTSPDAEIISR